MADETKAPKRTGAVRKAPIEQQQKKQGNPLQRYLRETRGELKKVTWPTPRESWRLTGIVVLTTIAMAAFLWAFDTLFSNGLQILIEQLIG